MPNASTFFGSAQEGEVHLARRLGQWNVLCCIRVGVSFFHDQSCFFLFRFSSFVAFLLSVNDFLICHSLSFNAI